jgi:drug/metabolite transporter (DMT)-like permease
METTNMRAQTTAMLLTVGAIFGSSFLLVKLLVAEMPPAQITAWRLLFGGMTIVIILAARRELRLPARSLLATSTMLTLLDSVIPNTLLAWAQIHIDSSIAAVLISSMPLFTVIFALLIPKGERISALKASGLVIGIAGVTVLVGADAQHAASGAPVAHLAVVLAAMSQAAGVVYARTALGKESPMELSGLKLMLGAAIAMVFAAVLHGGHAVPQMGPESWCTLLVLGVLSNALGRTMYLSLIASAGSIRASLVAYIVPVVGVLLGSIVLGERMTPGAAVGVALIVFGMTLVTHGPKLASMAPRRIATHPSVP